MGGLVLKAVSKNAKEDVQSKASSLFDFNANLINGTRVNLGELCKGKQSILVVNVATHWGLTPLNYAELVQLDEELRDKGFQILAFPCNQFAGQEPGTNEEIAAWAKKTHNVQFHMFEKTEVNGENACEIYQYLRQNSELYDKTDGKALQIPWNFAKFLVDGNGKVFKYFPPRVNPLSFKDDILNMCCHWAAEGINYSQSYLLVTAKWCFLLKPTFGQNWGWL